MSEFKTPDCDSPIRYVRTITDSRQLILRGEHWFCKDDGKPEVLWSQAAPFDMEAADEIVSLRQQLTEARAALLAEQVSHSNTSTMLNKYRFELQAERDEARQQLAEARAAANRVEAQLEASTRIIVEQKEELEKARQQLTEARAALARVALSETGDKCCSDFAQDILKWRSTSELWDIIKAAAAGGDRERSGT